MKNTKLLLSILTSTIASALFSQVAAADQYDEWVDKNTPVYIEINSLNNATQPHLDKIAGFILRGGSEGLPITARLNKALFIDNLANKYQYVGSLDASKGSNILLKLKLKDGSTVFTNPSESEGEQTYTWEPDRSRTTKTTYKVKYRVDIVNLPIKKNDVPAPTFLITITSLEKIN